jgi:hypothetical protein
MQESQSTRVALAFVNNNGGTDLRGDPDVARRSRELRLSVGGIGSHSRPPRHANRVLSTTLQQVCREMRRGFEYDTNHQISLKLTLIACRRKARRCHT